MPALSLFELAKKRLIKSIDLLNDVGDLPYHFLESILRFVQNPGQMQELEENCPQLRGETGDIWLKFIKRDIPNWEQKPHEPRDPKNWGKVYRKLKKEAEEEKKADAEALKQQFRAIQDDRAQNKTSIFSTRTHYGERPKQLAIPFSGRIGPPPKTGKVALDKLRKTMFNIKVERPKVQQLSDYVLAQRVTKIKAAPARMVRMAEHEASSSKVSPSAPVARSTEPRPIPKQPVITRRPVPQKTSPPPPRPSLPAGQQFHAPKPQPSSESAASTAPKRKRQDYSVFHQPKRRRM
ncbi:hypothetical protein IQ07DRAFT_392709 [Pyrenochaeta sp. DS3sAY3a]|nr:hypothetical protein IQ07DRAFT_392709 [Pyrenochaeta sp. DS3sAY3a]